MSAYLEDNKEQAFSHINGQHYPDTYKKPNHPTFSDESIYSTKETPGGHWGYQNGKDVFYPSEWQIETFGNNYILDGMKQQGDSDVIPVRMGGVMLPEVTVTPQYKEGGSIHISPSKKGTFTAAATKHGKSVQAFASQVLAHKENYSPAMVKKANFARNFGGHRHEDGGYNWRTPVGSNRSYLQTVKENLQTAWEKIKDNPFVNMIFPIKEVSNGNTEAILPLVIPGGGEVAETYRLLSPAAREAMSMSETEFKALYGVGKDYINSLLRSGNPKAAERAEKILGSIKSNISDSPTVTKVRQELIDFLTSRFSRGDDLIKGLQVDNVQNTPVRLWSENAGKSAFNEVGLYTANSGKNGSYGNIIVQDATDIPTIRHELGHSTLQMGMRDPYGFLEYSEEFLPIVDKGLPIEFQQYYTVPDEVRTRYLGLGVEAMKHNLTPTQFYRNAMEYGPRYVNYDPDIIDLLTRYDKESVLNYLGNIHSDGGYLDNLTTKPFSYQPIPEVRYKKGGFLKNTIDWLSSLFGLNQDETQQSEGIDLREIAARQAYAESGFDSNAKSNAGAMGLFQIMPSVLQDYNTKNNNTIPTDSLTNDSINTNVRNWYMNDLMNRGWNTKNNPSDSVRVAKALGAYNWGSGNLVNALNKAKADGVDIYNSWDWLSYLAPETRDYIDFILMGNNNSLHRNNIAYNTKSKQNQEKVDKIKNSFAEGGNLNSKNISNKNREIAKIKSQLEQLAINNNFSAEELKELRKFDEKSEVYKRAVELYKKYKYDF